MIIMIEKKVPRGIMYEKQQMSFISTLPFYATQMINPFLNSRISVNQDKVDGHSANGLVSLLYIDSLFIELTKKISNRLKEQQWGGRNPYLIIKEENVKMIL